MTELTNPAEDQLLARITIMENLLRQMIDIYVATTIKTKELDEKLGKIAPIIPTLANFIEILQNQPSNALTVKNDILEIKQRLAEFQQELVSIPRQIEAILEKSSTAHEPDASMMHQLVDRIESQQSTILQTLEKRVDPRLMIYLKPLIEMLEEEGRQAEALKNVALQQLQYLISGTKPGSNEEIAQVLAQVQQEIARCTESFARTQQALQIVVIPFQNIGRLFRDNLEIVVQAHDLMAQLYDDFPRFLDEMQKSHAQRHGHRP